MLLKYVGYSDVRSISKSEMPEGIDHEAVKWTKDNDFTAEVSDELGNWLREHERADWREVEAPKAEKQKARNEGSPPPANP